MAIRQFAVPGLATGGQHRPKRTGQRYTSGLALPGALLRGGGASPTRYAPYVEPKD